MDSPFPEVGTAGGLTEMKAKLRENHGRTQAMYTGIQGAGSLAAGAASGKSVPQVERDLGITAGNWVVLPRVVRRDDTDYLPCTPPFHPIQDERLPGTLWGPKN